MDIVNSQWIWGCIYNGPKWTPPISLIGAAMLFFSAENYTYLGPHTYFSTFINIILKQKFTNKCWYRQNRAGAYTPFRIYFVALYIRRDLYNQASHWTLKITHLIQTNAYTIMALLTTSHNSSAPVAQW